MQMKGVEVFSPEHFRKPEVFGQDLEVRQEHIREK